MGIGSFWNSYYYKKLVAGKKYDGLLTLGTVIRGATTHYELVTNEVAKGVAHINLKSDIPV